MTATRAVRIRLERSRSADDAVAWPDEYNDEVFFVLASGAALTRRAAIDSLVAVARDQWDQAIDADRIDESAITFGHFRYTDPDGDEGEACGPDHPDAWRYWRIPVPGGAR